jgi:hypothetical protein
MKVLGLREKVMVAVNQAIAPEGGYVDQDTVKLLSDTEKNENVEKITLTLVFQKNLRQILSIFESIQQAKRNPCMSLNCQGRCPLEPCQEIVRQSVGTQP